MKAARSKRPDREDTRDRIKTAAQRLMAEHGVDGVSVRAIVSEAGQRNMASLHYYFRTKEALIEELVVDAAQLMEGRRKAMLEALRASGATITVRDLVGVLVTGAVVDGDDDRSRTVLRFLIALFPNYRHLFEAAIGVKWNRTYQECLTLIRARANGMPRRTLDRRLLFASITMLQLLAARESARASGGRARSYWDAPDTVEGIVDAVYGMVAMPPTSETTTRATRPSPPQTRLAGAAPARTRRAAAGGRR